MCGLIYQRMFVANFFTILWFMLILVLILILNLQSNTLKGHIKLNIILQNNRFRCSGSFLYARPNELVGEDKTFKSISSLVNTTQWNRDI